MMNSGTVICGGRVTNSILGRNVKVEEGAEVERSILGNGVTIGSGSRLSRCIIDKHVLIPPGESIGFDLVSDARRFTVSDGGIVVVPRGYKFSAAGRNAPNPDGQFGQKLQSLG